MYIVGIKKSKFVRRKLALQEILIKTIDCH